jgi:hypothetical protein
MESDMDTLAIEELVTTVTFATNNEEFNMAVGRKRKYKDDEEFESIFRSNNCQLTEDVEFAKMYNMTAFEYNEMEGVHELDKAFDADVAEQDSGYQEVVCSKDEFGKFTQMWRQYAEHHDEIDTAGSSVKNC